MGWWSRLFGRGGGGRAGINPAPSRELPAGVAEPVAEAAPDPEPVVEATPEPDSVEEPEPVAEGEISPLRLDDALRRLRDEIPSPDEPGQS